MVIKIMLVMLKKKICFSNKHFMLYIYLLIDFYIFAFCTVMYRLYKYIFYYTSMSF